MKYKYYIITIIILFIAFAISSYIAIKTIKEKESLSECGSLRVQNILLKEGFFHSYDFSRYPLDLNMQVTDASFNNAPLSSYINGPTLFLFIDATGCNKCIMENIYRIKKFKKTCKIPIIVGVQTEDYSLFRSLVLQNNIDKYSFMLPTKWYEGFKLNPIFYFVADKYLNTNCFFAPSDAFPSLTDDYFQKVIELYSI